MWVVYTVYPILLIFKCDVITYQYSDVCNLSCSGNLLVGCLIDPIKLTDDVESFIKRTGKKVEQKRSKLNKKKKSKASIVN